MTDNVMHYDLKILKQIIITAAKEELLPRFNRVERQHKADGSIITEADIAIQQRIAGQLRQQWPDTEFLAEEMSAEQQASLLKSEGPIWCLDPIDGTSNFAAGIPYFCISLALINMGKISLGIVYDPMRDECFSASEDNVAHLNDEPLLTYDTGLTLKQATAIVDFKRLSPELATKLVRELPYASQRSYGSVALDWCWLAMGRGHVYLHGRSNIWDYSAGNYIFNKAGGYSCTLQGESVFIDELTPRSSVGAVDKKLFTEWISCLEINL